MQENTSGVKKIHVVPKEMEEIKTSINIIKENLDECKDHFRYMYETAFYLRGKAEEEVKRLIAIEDRNAIIESIPEEIKASLEAEITGIDAMGQDYYGKIQMLGTYYSLLETYVEKALEEIEIFDEKKSKAIATATSAIGGPKK